MHIRCFLTFELVTREPRAKTLYGSDIDEFNGTFFQTLTLSLFNNLPTSMFVAHLILGDVICVALPDDFLM